MDRNFLEKQHFDFENNSSEELKVFLESLSEKEILAKVQEKSFSFSGDRKFSRVPCCLAEWMIQSNLMPEHRVTKTLLNKLIRSGAFPVHALVQMGKLPEEFWKNKWLSIRNLSGETAFHSWVKHHLLPLKFQTFKIAELRDNTGLTVAHVSASSGQFNVLNRGMNIRNHFPQGFWRRPVLELNHSGYSVLEYVFRSLNLTNTLFSILEQRVGHNLFKGLEEIVAPVVAFYPKVEPVLETFAINQTASFLLVLLNEKTMSRTVFDFMETKTGKELLTREDNFKVQSLLRLLEQQNRDK